MFWKYYLLKLEIKKLKQVILCFDNIFVFVKFDSYEIFCFLYFFVVFIQFWFFFVCLDILDYRFQVGW